MKHPDLGMCVRVMEGRRRNTKYVNIEVDLFNHPASWHFTTNGAKWINAILVGALYLSPVGGTAAHTSDGGTCGFAFRVPRELAERWIVPALREVLTRKKAVFHKTADDYRQEALANAHSRTHAA